MTEPPAGELIPDEYLTYSGQVLIYGSPKARMAHIGRHFFGTTGDPLCNRPMGLVDGGCLGTGDQNEWERARRLPLCFRCFERVTLQLSRWRSKEHERASTRKV